MGTERLRGSSWVDLVESAHAVGVRHRESGRDYTDHVEGWAAAYPEIESALGRPIPDGHLNSAVTWYMAGLAGEPSWSDRWWAGVARRAERGGA